jgi:hypothetical protein
METTETERDVQPKVVDNYRDFEPPANFRKLLEDLLDAVPAKYFVGLENIVLANQSALTRNQRRQKIWSRNRKIRLADARGCYYRATKSSPATVWLYVDNILRSEEPWFRRLPILRYYALATVLFHEIGHHIHAVHKPVFEGKENVAEDWSKKLFGRFCRLRYWYLRPFVYPIWVLIRLGKRLRKEMSGHKRGSGR